MTDSLPDYDSGYVLVVGSSGVDVKGRPTGDLTWETPNLGQVRNSVGGVARNIAENLARLEVRTVLLTAVGDDAEGDRVIRESAETGIDCQYVRRVPGGRTGSYMALLRPDGDLHVAISDFEVNTHVDSDYLQQHERLFESAEMVAIDATLTEDALETLFELVSRYQLRVCADPTTPALAATLRPYIPQMYLIVPNAGETTVLCGDECAVAERNDAMSVARQLVHMGADIAVVTLGPMGLAYADQNGTGFIRATRVEVVDSTGAGDAFCAAAIFGILNEVPVDEAMRLGATAAALTLGSRETVLPNLTQEHLYAELVV